MTGPIAPTPPPPYWAVVFTSQRTADEGEDYGRMALRLEEIAPAQPGFLGLESVRDAAGAGITVSYWRDEASIAAWKRQALHLEAQRRGVAGWYRDYALRVAKVERAYTLADSARAGL
jgi:heme-degrading monooxygenase HmoA